MPLQIHCHLSFLVATLKLKSLPVGSASWEPGFHGLSYWPPMPFGFWMYSVNGKCQLEVRKEVEHRFPFPSSAALMRGSFIPPPKSTVLARNPFPVGSDLISTRSNFSTSVPFKNSHPW